MPLPEFNHSVLEMMRQPLLDRIISISSAKYSTECPVSFMLVDSMTPCPCFLSNNRNNRTSTVTKQLINLRFLMSICARGLRQRPLPPQQGAHQLYRNLDRSTYLGSGK
ncbi:MAG: ATP-binding protein [Muribaculaceae bacterium]|nr:ATP-binding protein [Muribaculaceae bacterium]